MPGPPRRPCAPIIDPRARHVSLPAPAGSVLGVVRLFPAQRSCMSAKGRKGRGGRPIVIRFCGRGEAVEEGCRYAWLCAYVYRLNDREVGNKKREEVDKNK